jgi:hypothetical protein
MIAEIEADLAENEPGNRSEHTGDSLDLVSF